ncbi:MAG: hypothetical protein WA354_13255 [Terracidiphilus sp.]
MKARIFILRALLFALVLAPSALRTSARPLGASSCRVAKPELRASHEDRRTGEVLDQLVASTPGNHAPATRLHRIRGKKISTQWGLVATPLSCAPSHFLVSDVRVCEQDMDGPNPSRGPPSHFSL